VNSGSSEGLRNFPSSPVESGKRCKLVLERALVVFLYVIENKLIVFNGLNSMAGTLARDLVGNVLFPLSVDANG